MLTKLYLKNFTSFKNETTIDLKSTEYKTLSDINVTNNILKGALFVGANASGKSNVLRGLSFILDLLFSDKIMELQYSKCLFSKKTSFELAFQFDIDNHIVEYLIEYDGQKKCFVREQLSLDGEVLLNRVESEGDSVITNTTRFSDIDPNGLLLREIYFNTKFRTHPILKRWFSFLLNSLWVDVYRGEYYSPGKHPVKLTDFIELPSGVETINEFFNQFHFDQRIEYSNSASGDFASFNSDKEKYIFFKREGVGQPIPFHLESIGNKTLLYLLPAFFHVINHGGMIILDEFSSGLHNFLEELLVRYFMKHSGQAQIFIASHSTNLLSNALLRPDQIYAVDFLGLEGSRVKRFSSEKPREAQNLEKMYTSGVFGGVPRYRDDDDHTE